MIFILFSEFCSFIIVAYSAVIPKRTVDPDLVGHWEGTFPAWLDPCEGQKREREADLRCSLR